MYGHVKEELEDAPNLQAEEAIRRARQLHGMRPYRLPSAETA
jgi:hypothetical protein